MPCPCVSIRARLAAGLTLMPFASQAAFDVEPWASLQYEYDSNVFEESSGDEALDSRGTRERADRVWQEAVGLDAVYELGPQSFRVEAEGRHFDYARFKDVERDEHHLLAAVDWSAGPILSGALNFRNERRAASFADLDSGRLSLQREQTLGALFNLALTPKWTWTFGSELYELELPLPQYPAFELETARLSSALNYGGFADLKAGLFVEYSDGEYSGVPDATRFDEWVAQLTAEYKIGGLSTLTAMIGVVSRNEDRTDEEVSGFAGSLRYQRAISPKTAFMAEAFRRVSSYVAGANALVESGIGAGVNWRPSAKTATELAYNWVRSDFQQDSISSVAAVDGREDEYGTLRAAVSWDARRWLRIRGFGEYRDRRSNTPDQGFEASLIGVELRASF